ncbi:hypothetical protein DUNSADRAFT_17862 [Dunaliella salina]|nr:hypothetical protein DUNSADRAFT_17862 [Dunaliella salina]|eukprot:KAF5828280.1 hypothetical protein DUNSADRAFT_17862 [Dunaliella salina]
MNSPTEVHPHLQHHDQHRDQHHLEHQHHPQRQQGRQRTGVPLTIQSSQPAVHPDDTSPHVSWPLQGGSPASSQPSTHRPSNGAISPAGGAATATEAATYSSPAQTGWPGGASAPSAHQEGPLLHSSNAQGEHRQQGWPQIGWGKGRGQQGLSSGSSVASGSNQHTPAAQGQHEGELKGSGVTQGAAPLPLQHHHHLFAEGSDVSE